VCGCYGWNAISRYLIHPPRIRMCCHNLLWQRHAIVLNERSGFIIRLFLINLFCLPTSTMPPFHLYYYFFNSNRFSSIFFLPSLAIVVLPFAPTLFSVNVSKSNLLYHFFAKGLFILFILFSDNFVLCSQK
jgi:hypothetical protein